MCPQNGEPTTFTTTLHAICTRIVSEDESCWKQLARQIVVLSIWPVAASPNQLLRHFAFNESAMLHAYLIET